MNPLVHRGPAAETALAPPGDEPMQAPPQAEDSARALGAEEAAGRWQGELFLPGWLRIERDPQAEQGPGA